MKTNILFLLAFIVFAPNSIAQAPPPERAEEREENEEKVDEKGMEGFWEAKLAGGAYVVALGRISTVSRHKYVLDGALIVDEVTIDTVGQAIARFYHISPIVAGGAGETVSKAIDRAVGMADGAATRAGMDVQNMVVKKYPITTHAKTIEYRVLTEKQLDSLYQSVKTAWTSGRARTFTVK